MPNESLHLEIPFLTIEKRSTLACCLVFRILRFHCHGPGSIRHNKKDGAVSILETIFCEFWSVATTVKKIFDKLCNFIDDLRFLCMNSGVKRVRSAVKDRIFYRSRA